MTTPSWVSILWVRSLAIWFDNLSPGQMDLQVDASVDVHCCEQYFSMIN